MRILFPTGSFYPAQTGGIDNSVYWITKGLFRQKIDVRIVSTERGIPAHTPRNQWRNDGFGRIIYTKNSIHYFPIRLLWEARRQLREAEVLHLTMIFYPVSCLMAFWNKWFYQKPVVWSIRGDLDTHMLKRSRKKKKVVLWLIRKWLKKDALFHATCQEEIDYAKAALGEDIRVVNITNYMELPEVVKVPKSNYLLFLGRIDAKKGIDRLLKALAQSTAFLDSDFTLKIAGDHQNAYGKYLQNLVEALHLDDRVEFLGLVKGKDKQRLLAAAYFAFMPSHTENFGIVVAEALAQGTPAVASIYTPWQLLEEQKVGYWVDNSVEQLRQTVDTIFQLSAQEYKAMRNRTREIVTTNLDIYEHIGEWQTVYEQLRRQR